RGSRGGHVRGCLAPLEIPGRSNRSRLAPSPASIRALTREPRSAVWYGDPWVRPGWFAPLVSYCDGGVDRPSQRLRVRRRRQARERSERYLRRVRRDVQGADRDLAAVGDDADQTLRQHPRFAAMGGLAGGGLREQSAERGALGAGGGAFWVVISALPTVVAVVSLLRLAVSPERVAADLGTLARDAPSSLGGLLTEQLRQVTVSDHAGVSLGLAVSVVLAIWSASAGGYHLDRAILGAYGL